jgi:micrococcal nuclease
MSRSWNKRDFAPRRRRRSFSISEIRLAALGGVFLGLAVATLPTPSAMDTRPLSAFEAIRVIDGDTFEQGGVRIRIADIDTPELDGRCAEEIRRARQARQRTSALLHAGPFELHRISGRDEDRYGRKLRIVTREGRSLGDQLVAEGLARTWSGRRQPWC